MATIFYFAFKIHILFHINLVVLNFRTARYAFAPLPVLTLRIKSIGENEKPCLNLILTSYLRICIKGLLNRQFCNINPLIYET